ncbi:hypothetical protein LXL04_013517 [Taraxacum kok-saghyz]
MLKTQKEISLSIEIRSGNPNLVTCVVSLSIHSRVLPSPFIIRTSSHHFRRSLRRFPVIRPPAPIAAARNTSAALHCRHTDGGGGSGEVDDLMLMVLVVATQVFCGNGGEKLLQLAEGLLKKHIASHSLHEPEALTVYISLLEQQAKYRDATEVLSGNLGSLIMIEVDKLRIQRNWGVVNEVAWMRFEDGWFVWKFVVECLGLVLNNLNLVCLKYIKVRTHGFKPKPKSYGLNPRTHETVKPPHETVKPNPLQTHRVGFRKLETDLAGSWVGFTPNPSKPYPCSPLVRA